MNKQKPKHKKTIRLLALISSLSFLSACGGNIESSTEKEYKELQLLNDKIEYIEKHKSSNNPYIKEHVEILEKEIERLNKNRKGRLFMEKNGVIIHFIVIVIIVTIPVILINFEEIKIAIKNFVRKNRKSL